MKKLSLGNRSVLLGCVGITLVAIACLCATWFKGRAFGVAKVNTILPANELTTDAEISPDGSQIAMMYEVVRRGVGLRQGIEIRDLPTGREEGNTIFPSVGWSKGERQFNPTRHRLRYCDAGKYLLALTFPDRLLVIDAHTLQVHGSVAISDLQVFNAGTAPRRFADDMFPARIDIDCSAESNVAVVASGTGDRDVLSIKLFDMDKVTELDDLANIFHKEHERYAGDELALSPDGSKIAMVVYRFSRWNGGEVAEVIDTSSKTIVGTLTLGVSVYDQRQLAFAGNSALMIGLRECRPDEACRLRTVPEGKTLLVWQFGGGGGVQAFGWDGRETYRSFGASSDGSRIFGYTGAESFCKSCNGKSGELKIKDARFTVWDRNSGRVIARSPSIRVRVNRCPWIQFMGSCSERYDAPSIEGSDDGKTFLTFTPGLFPSEQNSKDFGELNVFRAQ